jgi:hypothetical protein
MTYRLNIHKIDQSCLFELTWGNGQRISAKLAFPAQLMSLYEKWRQTYLGYYKQGLRAWAETAGQLSKPDYDWHSELTLAEARLLSEFHKWLKHAELFDLREVLMQVARQAGTEAGIDAPKPELFLTCSPIEIEHLPWETWELGRHLQMVRSPLNIRAETTNRRPFRKGKARVLAILGDETGLDFAGERTALNAQRKVLDIHYVGWQPGEEKAALKHRICQQVADPQGWDVLFFAGHSNESSLLDGQIAIAPNTAISIKELSPYLKQAQQRGLQFALFNSCCGLDIANGLINLGLSQVAIMREPIHNQVAQDFLVQFLQRLANFEDVQVALTGACQFLKLEQNLTYPSAYLVPSLFRHPDSVPYQIPATDWRSRLRRWQPNQREVVTLGALAVISMLPPVQDWLMEQRVRTQAMYRNVTGQLADSPQPPVILIQIDDATLQYRRISEPVPIDRPLLADLVTQLSAFDPSVIGIDYMLDRPTDGDRQLYQALTQAVAEQGQRFVFATKRSHLGEWLSIHPDIASLNWSLEGDIRVPLWHIYPRGWSDKPLPFTYQLAVAHYLSQDQHQGLDPPVPDLKSSQKLQALNASYWEDLQQGTPLSPWTELHPVTNLSYWLYQRWLQPLLDFSLPPEQVYSTVPAWQLLEEPEQVLQELGLNSLANQIVIIVAGGYDEAGTPEVGGDNWPQPAAMGYWRNQAVGTITGGEAHAYMAHHFLTNHLVVPVPDLWMVLTAALMAKGLMVGLANASVTRWLLWLLLMTAGYGVLTLQLYISWAVLLPCLLPSITFWLYLWPYWRTQHD